MSKAQHVGLAAGRWYSMSLAEQMGNIGSEVNRAITARKQNDAQRVDNALMRALELFDLTISDKRRIKQLKEIIRAREVVADYFYDNNYKSDSDWLNEYFLQFGMAARLNR